MQKEFQKSCERINWIISTIPHRISKILFVYGSYEFLAMLEGKIREAPFFKVQSGRITVWNIFLFLIGTFSLILNRNCSLFQLDFFLISYPDCISNFGMQANKDFFSLFESPLNSNLQACILIQFQLKLTNTKNTNTTSNYKKHLYVSTRVSKINVFVRISVFGSIFFYS